jgi:hypothetical protein
MLLSDAPAGLAPRGQRAPPPPTRRSGHAYTETRTLPRHAPRPDDRSQLGASHAPEDARGREGDGNLQGGCLAHHSPQQLLCGECGSRRPDEILAAMHEAKALKLADAVTHGARVIYFRFKLATKRPRSLRA